MIWVVLVLLSLVVVAILLVPFLRSTSELRRRADYDIVVYRSQLAEIDQEIEEGLLTAEQADAARAEVHRRMLAAEDAEMKHPLSFLPNTGRYARIIAAAAIGLMIPVGALLMYGALGSPKLPGKPYMWRVHNDPAFAASVTADTLAALVEARPSAEGYAQLAHTYFAAQQYEPAVAAYRRAFTMGTKDPVSWSEFGEATVMLNNGAVIPEAMNAFINALGSEPRSERSRFYLGLAEAQIGELRKAVSIWRDLEKSSDPDAPWLPMLREHIAAFAKQGGFDPQSVPAAPPDLKAIGSATHTMGSAIQNSAPAMVAAPPLAAAPTQSAAMRDPTIAAMVQRLADKMEKNPSDVAGWQRLAHAYAVMGEGAKAVAAANRAAALKPNDVSVLISLAEAQKVAAPASDDVPADVLATMKKVLAVDPKNGEALYVVGLSEAKAGHGDKAKVMWNEALKTLPKGDPLAMEIQHRLAGVAVK